jgi:hypothetical protein
MARYAVCFGISNQTYLTLPCMPQCASDAKEMGEFLSQPTSGFEVVISVDPSAKEMQAILYRITQQCRSEDELLIYFSGHGRRGRNRKLYLCASDTNSEALIISGLSFDHLLEIIKENSVNSLLLILDCCYSGAAESSFMIKSSDDLLDESAKDNFAKGWTILTSTNQIGTTAICQSMRLSPFTDKFLKACKVLQDDRHGWITITHVYEELRFRIIDDHPKLFGENVLYRLCRGIAPKQALTQTGHVTEREIEFRGWDGTYFAFYGLLVLPYFRAWLVLNPPNERIDGAVGISDAVDIVSNKSDAFQTKVNKAIQQITGAEDSISRLSFLMNAKLTLLLPIRIPDITYRRFTGTDHKYVFRNSFAVERRQYPVIGNRNIHCISLHSSEWRTVAMPEDYLKEAFGVNIDYQGSDSFSSDESTFILREDSLSRNAKYVSICRYTQKILDFAIIDAKFGERRTSLYHSVGRNGRLDAAIAARRYGTIPTTGAEVIETSFQREKREGNSRVECGNCMDEREVVVELNTRRYRVPCPLCSHEKDQSSIWFFGDGRSGTTRMGSDRGAGVTRAGQPSTSRSYVNKDSDVLDGDLDLSVESSDIKSFLKKWMRWRRGERPVER